MNITTKRSVILLLIASLFVYLAACSKSSGNSSEPGSTASSSGPVTLTFWSAPTGSNLPMGIQDDPVSKYIEQKLGVKIDMDTKATDEKLAALLATNDLKDIMVVHKKYAQQMKDMVIDMGPLLEKHGPDILRNVPGEVLTSDKKMADGQLKFLSNKLLVDSASPEPLWGGVYLRWDYYKELGYPAINNNDDFLKVVSQMLQKHPANEDGKKYYGFSLWSDWGWPFHTNNFSIQNKGASFAYGGPANVVQIDDQTFERTNMYLNENSGFWEDVAFWNKAQRMGLLDPDSFTQKYDQAQQKYNTGQVLASVISWMIGGSNTYLQGKGVYDKGWYGPLPMPSEQYKYFNKKFGSDNWVFAISKKSKHPERAMELINWLYSVEGALTVTNGIEGVDWVNKNGKYEYTDTFLSNSKDPDAVSKYGYGKFGNNLGLNASAYIPGTKNPISFKLTKDFQKAAYEKPEAALTREVLQHYKAELTTDILPPGRQYKSSSLFELMGFVPSTEPDDIKLISDKLTNYLNQAIPKIILTKSDEAFASQKAAMIKELLDLGLEKVYAFWDTELQKGIAEWKAVSGKK